MVSNAQIDIFIDFIVKLCSLPEMRHLRNELVYRLGKQDSDEFNERVSSILDIWEEKGLDAAMEKYAELARNEKSTTTDSQRFIFMGKPVRPKNKYEISFGRRFEIEDFKKTFKCEFELRPGTRKKIEVTIITKGILKRDLVTAKKLDPEKPYYIFECTSQRKGDFYLICNGGELLNTGVVINL